MNVYFHSAVGDVAGSAYHIKTKYASVLVDCGLFQGGRQAEGMNRRLHRLAGGKLDAVVLTHEHLDHVGRLPIRTKRGCDERILHHLRRNLHKPETRWRGGSVTGEYGGRCPPYGADSHDNC